jgi:hypothetical protein
MDHPPARRSEVEGSRAQGVKEAAEANTALGTRKRHMWLPHGRRGASVAPMQRPDRFAGMGQAGPPRPGRKKAQPGNSSASAATSGGPTLYSQ